MPELVTYKGRPVRRRYETPTGLKLIFFSPNPGRSGGQLIVSDVDWLRHSSIQFFTKDQMPDVRVLAAQFD